MVPGTLESDQVEVVGYHDLDGRPGFKLAMTCVDDRWLLYLGHFWHSGWSIVDVTDPEDPQLVTFVDGPPDTWTLQVQLADGLFVAGLEPPRPGWGRTVSDATEEGVLLFDVDGAKAMAPELLGHYATGGSGTHRNHYAGGRYAFLAASPEGFVGQILVIVDVSDPGSPREVSRWWWPGQHVAAGETPEHHHYFHGPAYVDGTKAYLGYGGVGMVILDISDITHPTLVSTVSFGDFGSTLGCHSAVPLQGRDLVVVNSEAIKEGAEESLNYAVVVDVADPVAPRIASWLPTPRPRDGLPYSNYFDKGGRFGPHNQHHHQGQDHLWNPGRHVVMTYFNAGIRIYDLADPLAPREVGCFVPRDPERRIGALPRKLISQSEDVLVDSRGFIYCTDKNHGLFILRFTPGLE